MKCPVCGETLKPSKKDPDYLLCYTCKKKYKMPKKAQASQDAEEKADEEPVKKAPKKKKTSASAQSGKKSEKQKYSNIPPKDVRDKREREMKKAYDEMLAVEDEKVSKAPVIILAIAIIIVALAIAYMLFFR